MIEVENNKDSIDELEVEKQKDYTHTNCVICGNKKHKSVVKLCSIQAERGKKIFNFSRLHNDAVYIRTQSAENAEDFQALNLKYHKICLRSYERAYAQLNKGSMTTSKKQASELQNAILNVIENLQSRIDSGEILSLSDVSQLINDEHNYTVKHSKIKAHLINFYGDRISFVYPKQKSSSILFHSSNVGNIIDDSYKHDCINKCAETLKNCLKETDFSLANKFCDRYDLQSSWENANIPEPFLQFFTKLFDIDKQDILKTNLNHDLFDEALDVSHEIKSLRVKSLFQIIYYMRYNGRKKTSLHTLISLFVHSSTRSKSVIMALNRLGLSISYDEILRIRTRLALYTTTISENRVPLPIHFNSTNYVTAAFDNFDHIEATLSGLDTTHDTVSVLFQDQDSNYHTTKPDISSISIDSRARALTTQLKCQELLPLPKLPSVINLSSDYIVVNNNDSLTISDYQQNLHVKDFIWFLSRMCILDEQISLENSNQTVPSWSSFNSIVSEDN